MDKFIIEGGRALTGTVTISGSKNATLPLMAATLLAPGAYRFTNVPRLQDVTFMGKIMETLGVGSTHTGPVLALDSRTVRSFEAPYDLVRKMRASIYVMGPLTARYGRARVSLPGGCAWGPRPVDFHIQALQRLGAQVDLDGGYIVTRADRLRGARITFETSSVGATGNTLMAAVLARGETVIENAAREPEIAALARHLIAMGARIDGVETERLTVQGVDDLHPADAAMIPDRIEAGTFLLAAAITGGNLLLQGARGDHLSFLLGKLLETGLECRVTGQGIQVTATAPVRAADVTTGVYPGFPTDMQAQWTALMSVTPGLALITETIYPDRFNHVPELRRLGADISVEGNTAVVKGAAGLRGAPVMSTDLRASASLILAGLRAAGTTEVLRVYHIDRGYEQIERKLQALGAAIRRVSQFS